MLGSIHIAVTLVLVTLILIWLMIPLIAVATSAERITGALAYSTRNGDLPMRDTYYEVWKKCGFFDLMTCVVSSGKTDLNGLFDSTIDGGDCNCWVRVFTKVPDVVDLLCADEPNAACHTQSRKAATLQYDFSSINIKSGDTLDYGKHILPSSTLAAEGAQISDTIFNTWLFVRGQVGVNIPSVSVQFPCDALCSGETYFDPYTIGHIYVKPNEDAKTIINSYAQYVIWYHTTGLSETQVTTLFEKSLQQKGDVVLLVL